MDFTLVTGRLVENVHQYLNVLRLQRMKGYQSSKSLGKYRGQYTPVRNLETDQTINFRAKTVVSAPSICASVISIKRNIWFRPIACSNSRNFRIHQDNLTLSMQEKIYLSFYLRKQQKNNALQAKRSHSCVFLAYRVNPTVLNHSPILTR